MQLENNLFLNMTAQQRAETELDIFLVGGQANAAGAASIADAAEEIRDHNKYENVRYCTRRPVCSGAFEEWDESCGPVQEGLGYDRDHIGPELGMAQVMNDAFAAPDKKALIIKGAARGVTLMLSTDEGSQYIPTKSALERYNERGSWFPFENGATDLMHPAGMLLRNLLSFTEKMYRELTALGFKKVHFSAMVWMQGEDDRYITRREEYPVFFKKLTERIRGKLTELTGEDYSDLPFILGEISESFNKMEQLELNRYFIALQNERLPKAVNDVHIVHTGGLEMTALNENGEQVILGSTQWHWNYADMLTAGRLFGEACLKYAKK